MSQIKAISVTVFYSAIMTAVVFYVASLITKGTRVSEDTENIGLDENIHGEKAFNI